MVGHRAAQLAANGPEHGYIERAGPVARAVGERIGHCGAVVPHVVQGGAYGDACADMRQARLRRTGGHGADHDLVFEMLYLAVHLAGMGSRAVVLGATEIGCCHPGHFMPPLGSRCPARDRAPSSRTMMKDRCSLRPHPPLRRVG